jgi:hypothetical protein
MVLLDTIKLKFDEKRTKFFNVKKNNLKECPEPDSNW